MKHISRVCLVALLLLTLTASTAFAKEPPLIRWKYTEAGDIVAIKDNKDNILSETEENNQYKDLTYNALEYLEVARNPSDFVEVPYAFIGRVAQQNNFQGSPDVEVVILVEGDADQMISCSAKGFKDWTWQGAFAKSGVEQLLPKDWVYVEGMLTGTKAVATADGTAMLLMPSLQIHSIKILK